MPTSLIRPSNNCSKTNECHGVCLSLGAAKVIDLRYRQLKTCQKEVDHTRNVVLRCQGALDESRAQIKRQQDHIKALRSQVLTLEQGWPWYTWATIGGGFVLAIFAGLAIAL